MMNEEGDERKFFATRFEFGAEEVCCGTPLWVFFRTVGENHERLKVDKCAISC